MHHTTISERRPPPDGHATMLRGHFCAACGAALDAADRFCVDCGRARAESRAVTAGETLSPLEAARRLLAAGDHVRALTALEGLRRAEPGHPLVLAYLGVAYLRAARVNEARDALDEAVRLGPESFSCHMARAEFHARLGYFDRAVESIDHALGCPMPSLEARQTALEFRRDCSEKARGLFYRQIVPVRWPRVLRRLSSRFTSPDQSRALDARSIS